MSQTISKAREFVTKEIFIGLIPFLASYMWTIFFEAGFSSYYGIPHELISLNLTGVFLTNRLSLLAAVVGFLWIGLYYNLMPSFKSLSFKAIITLFLALSIAVGALFGRYSASVNEYYYRLNTTPEQIVLRIYDDNIITAPFDSATKTFERSFFIHRLGDEPALRMSYEKLGPLHSVDEM